MRIVQANAFYDHSCKTPAALLDASRALTEWSEAVAAAGATVSVVQRFHTAGTLEHNGIAYHFVTDRQRPWLSAGEASKPLVDAIVAQSPDIVHINGLTYPALVAALRTAVGPAKAIVAQHRAGEYPIRGSGLVGWWQQRQWRGGLAAATALSFTAREQAEPWRAAGVLGDHRIIEIVETSTTLRTVERSRARAAINVDGSPIILWAGRRTTSSDPLTVLDGLERVLAEAAGAQIVMVCDDDTLLPAVDARVRSSPILASRAIVAGRVSDAEMPNYYGAADLLVSGSHDDGGSAVLIESLAAGVVPIVSELPAYHAIAGDCGWRWRAGDARQLAEAIHQALASDLATQRQRARARFDHHLSWDAIGRRTVDAYRSLMS